MSIETISKTRTLFLNAARKLFALVGYDKTTMNDIAVESQRGRRTLYTYFKNKNEVFSAVIELELESLSAQLLRIIESPMSPTQKIELYVQRRLELISEVVKRNGSLNAAFFQDITLVERARLRFDVQETHSIQSILQEGVDSGVFAMCDTALMAAIIHNSLKGLEVPYIKGRLSSRGDHGRSLIVEIRHFLLHGLTTHQA